MANPPPVEWRDPAEHRRKLAESSIGILDGRTNAAGSFTLTASTAATVVADNRVGPDSVICWMPKTANAAAEIGAGTLYVSSRTGQSFTLSHASNAQTDRDFEYIVAGTGRGT